MFGLEKRKLMENLIILYRQGVFSEVRAGLSCCACSDRTRGNGFKLGQKKFR